MIKVIALLNKEPEYSQAEFRRRWLEDHTKLSAQLPNLKGHRINLALPDKPEENLVDGIVPHDGTAELWFDSPEEVDARFASDIGQRASADADEFADLRIHIFTGEYVMVPGAAS